MVDHRFAEARFVVEHVMRNAERVGDAARVVDVLAGAAGALAMRRRAVIVELQRDADDVVALALQQRGHDGGIDAARHGDDDARFGRRLLESQTVEGAVRSRRKRWRKHIRSFAGEMPDTQGYLGLLARSA